MEAILGIIRPIFWGLLMLSVLVFVHEGGHFLASRAVGVRVTEFFLGLPCRFNLHHVSKRIGTKFGVTPLLLGGYAMVCGMEPEGDAGVATRVLSAVHRHGTVGVEELAEELGVTEDEAMEACVQLADWGSIAPVYAEGEKPGVYYATTYAAMPRDAAGDTMYDGRRFRRDAATSEGEVWEPPMSAEAFYAQERSRTYAGKGFWARAFILVAGVAVNLLSGFLLLMSIYMIVGVNVSIDVNQVGAVQADSPAAVAGIEAGDTITAVNGTEVDSFTAISSVLAGCDPAEPISVTVERGGSEQNLSVNLDGASMFGISAPVETVHLNPVQATTVTWGYVSMTADSIVQLFNPQHTMEVLDNSTSVVGIMALSAEAASAGAATYLTFAALISFSLGFMNLLPIPPLDGGKLVIEIIQAIIRRPVPAKVQAALSYVGVGLFILLFIYMLRADLIRFVL